ncbi:MAG TPA: hypothetical protein VII16_06400 [Actinomycetes bacterium]
MTERPGVYTVDELVELFDGRRRRSAVYEDIRRGAIPSVRLGRRLFIPAWFVDQLRDGGRGDHRVSGGPSTSANDPDTRRGT